MDADGRRYLQASQPAGRNMMLRSGNQQTARAGETKIQSASIGVICGQLLLWAAPLFERMPL
jgi:hypothetical protein